jgi:alpha-beta hydrolase superfamily lysophospholipase
MKEPMPDYSLIDQPSTLMYIFYPRKDFTLCPGNAFDLLAPVDDHVSVHCRFYIGNEKWPWILFFHGNGEVVSDYDEIAPVYHQRGMNLVVADYRGYGNSNGVPTLTDLIRDAHAILREVKKELSKRGLRNDLWVMGRSLGSISAFELGYRYQDMLNGLIIESGFPSIVRIILHLGIPVHGVNLKKIDQECLEMIHKIFLSSLIIHGERDTLVPLREAKDIYEHLGTDKKELLIIPSADHNNIMPVGYQKYFDAIQRFMEMTEQKNQAT